MYFYCHASTLPLCYENNENWPKNYNYFKELPFLITNFVRSDVITNSPKMLTKQKKNAANLNFHNHRGFLNVTQSIFRDADIHLL